MQTRDDLYKYLDYHAYEQKLDALFCGGEGEGEMSTPRIAVSAKPKKSVALSGVAAGNTALCSVGQQRQRPALPRLRHPRSGRDLRVRGDRLSTDPRQAAEQGASSPPTRPSSRTCAAFRRRCAPCSSNCRRPRIPWTSCAPARRRWAACCPRRTTTIAAGAREIADHLVASFGVDALLLVSLLAQRPAHPRRDRRRFRRRALPAPAASPAAAGELGARHAHLAQSLRRARVQFLHVHGARDRRHRLGHLLLHHRRHRRVARAQTRRRQRSGARNPGALRHAGRSRGRHPPARRRTRRSSSASAIRCTPCPIRATSIIKRVAGEVRRAKPAT